MAERFLFARPFVVALLLAPTASCNYVSGLSIVNDTGAQLAIEADFSSQTRMAVSSDCYNEGTTMEAPVQVTLSPGQRVCFLGPLGETSDYDLRERLKSLVVWRGTLPCLHAVPQDLSGRYRNDGRNAAQQNALHIDDGWCTSH